MLLIQDAQMFDDGKSFELVGAVLLSTNAGMLIVIFWKVLCPSKQEPRAGSGIHEAADAGSQGSREQAETWENPEIEMTDVVVVQDGREPPVFEISNPMFSGSRNFVEVEMPDVTTVHESPENAVPAVADEASLDMDFFGNVSRVNGDVAAIPQRRSSLSDLSISINGASAMRRSSVA